MAVVDVLAHRASGLDVIHGDVVDRSQVLVSSARGRNRAGDFELVVIGYRGGEG